jgi:hypothetical protein
LPKFYVRIGAYRVVMTAETEKQAVERAVLKASVRYGGNCPYGKLTTVSEVGFDEEGRHANPDHGRDQSYSTTAVFDRLLKEVTKKKKNLEG